MTDRRTTIKLIIAAASAMPAMRARATYKLEPGASAPGPLREFEPTLHGYGPDPDLIKAYERGAFWPLTLTAKQRQLAASLSDLIIPADEHSPSASAVGVVDFIDEWISAPYPQQREDRETVLQGFAWLDAEAQRRTEARARSEQSFAELPEAQQRAICDRICNLSRASADLQQPAQFFAVYRNLTAAGFYTTLAGRKDLKYIGNVALTHFDGPPTELLKKLGLA
ncbi:MAG TPA: gluconate 2-dehydrogenase subunit 3 family protein [Steroidobacteraceae bacterium]|nr:gluconate 2-dehydrogenase subunit 3 family protein [Steroidobacteraceae bacterium]